MVWRALYAHIYHGNALGVVRSPPKEPLPIEDDPEGRPPMDEPPKGAIPPDDGSIGLIKDEPTPPPNTPAPEKSVSEPAALTPLGVYPPPPLNTESDA